jgi:hypothetical protein
MCTLTYRAGENRCRPGRSRPRATAGPAYRGTHQEMAITGGESPSAPCEAAGSAATNDAERALWQRLAQRLRNLDDLIAASPDESAKGNATVQTSSSASGPG